MAPVVHEIFTEKQFILLCRMQEITFSGERDNEKIERAEKCAAKPTLV